MMNAVGGKIKETATNEHLDWLVRNRSKNQKSSLKLRRLMTEFDEKIFREKNLHPVADLLLAINFSLWRAVFLSNVQDGDHHIFKDAKKFIDELIENNIILYTQDKNSAEFTFTYYMFNARFRLELITKTWPNILSKHELTTLVDPSDKHWWAHHQKALNRAIKNLRAALEA